MINWSDGLNVAITVCDKDFKIVYMNEKSVKTFEKYGGKDLIGGNLLDCHSDNSKVVLKEMMVSGISNTYTIEKEGIKKLIHQTPCYENGIQNGIVEFSVELPFEMAHHIRD